jgi:TonB family protein
MTPFLLILAFAADPSPPPTASAGVLIPSTHIITQPDWVEEPTGQDITEAYPPFARAQGIGGRATIECSVNGDGTLSACEVLSESPIATGFGGATLRVAGRFRMRPVLVAGKPLAGARVRISQGWAVSRTSVREGPR